MTLEVANTILDQLGANRFRAMTGAKNFIGDVRSLRFDLPRGLATNKATKVLVTLTEADLYKVEFFKWNARKLELNPIEESDNVHAEDLRRVFTSKTGLDCTL